MSLNIWLLSARGVQASVVACETEFVSTRRTFRLMFDGRICKSWKPRQVPQIFGNIEGHVSIIQSIVKHSQKDMMHYNMASGVGTAGLLVACCAISHREDVTLIVCLNCHVEEFPCRNHVRSVKPEPREASLTAFSGSRAEDCYHAGSSMHE